jgi:hypothetical protein
MNVPLRRRAFVAHSIAGLLETTPDLITTSGATWTLEQENAMRIYVFKSETTEKLRAFAGDPDVNKLPRQHGPWTVTGAIGPESPPPHKFSREAIEKAIGAEGFQLWRLRDK